MQAPTQYAARTVAEDTKVLGSYLPVPGFGLLPVNAFVILGAQPALVDTGLPALREGFLKSLWSVVDPADLRWLFLTHTDTDHIGSLREVLEAAPRARLVTTYVGMAKLSLAQLPVDRVHLLNPGQSLDLGDRRVSSVRVPTFDAPETTGVLDHRTRALFSADCFGALLGERAEAAEEIPAQSLREGMLGWSAVDAPWLQVVDPRAFARSIDRLRELDPDIVLSGHLPPARGLITTLCDHLADAHAVPAFEGPDQEALEKMMAETPEPSATSG